MLIPQGLWDQGSRVVAGNVADGSSLSFLLLCMGLAAPLPFLLCLNWPQGHLLQEGLLQLPVELLDSTPFCFRVSPRRLKIPPGASLLFPTWAELP